MKTLWLLIKRNTKMFFRDKGTFFVSLITPIILLILYVTFLGNVYRNSYAAGLPEGVNMSKELMDGLVGSQLFSSLLAVSCVTVSFCSNLLMVQDKVTGAKNDLLIAPLGRGKLALSYYVSTFFSTILISLVATIACFIYLAVVGWFMTVVDVILIFFDVFLLVMFGTALSSVINHFLSSQGQISAVGSIVSSCYGFICGAYMPISSFGTGLQKVLSFLPGTYGTSLIRNHAMRGVFEEMKNQGFSNSVVESFRSSIDCEIKFFGNTVGIGAMYAIMIVSVLLLISAYVLLNVLAAKKSNNKQKKNQG